MSEAARTPDGRHVVVDGRRWRASDPAIPEALRASLVNELMAARRAVATARGDDTALAAARARVGDAKHALGERGRAWWEPWDPDAGAQRIGAAVRTLLRARDASSSICPSEAARVVGDEGWRDRMDAVREVAARMAGDGHTVTTQGGEPVDTTSATGPIRLARGPRFPHPP